MDSGIIRSKTDRLKQKNAFDGSLVMGVKKFNQATGRDRHIADPLEALIDPATGLVKKELVKDRACPICGGRFEQAIFVKKGFPHGRCPDCGLIYVSPVLKDETVLEHYREESSWVQVMESGPQVELDRLKYAYGLETASKDLAGKRLLDVGTGTGLFLKIAKCMGFQSTGLELHNQNVEKLKECGFEVVDVPLEKAGLASDEFDLVTMWEVLEHIEDPVSLLRESARIMKPGGRLLILVPNVDSLVTRLLHEKSGTFGGHSHVNHFNVKTLTRLLDLAGFEVLEAETIITELGTINNHLGFEDPYNGAAGDQLDFITPEMIHEKMLGSKLLVLARIRTNEETRQ